MDKRTQAANERKKHCEEVLEAYMNDPRYKLHHSAMTAHCISRLKGPVVSEYSGKFGKGIMLEIPATGKSNKYHPVYYFIERRDKDEDEGPDIPVDIES